VVVGKVLEYVAMAAVAVKARGSMVVTKAAATWVGGVTHLVDLVMVVAVATALETAVATAEVKVASMVAEALEAEEKAAVASAVVAAVEAASVGAASAGSVTAADTTVEAKARGS
jgi:hypothetical protein